MNTRPRPCGECPWRKDVAPGQFPPERYQALRCTAPGPEGHPKLGAPLFACHKSAEGRELPCAGWLAAVGREHLSIRLSAAQGDIDPELLQPGEDWPELYDDYDDLLKVHG